MLRADLEQTLFNLSEEEAKQLNRPALDLVAKIPQLKLADLQNLFKADHRGVKVLTTLDNLAKHAENPTVQADIQALAAHITGENAKGNNTVAALLSFKASAKVVALSQSLSAPLFERLASDKDYAELQRLREEKSMAGEASAATANTNVSKPAAGKPSKGRSLSFLGVSTTKLSTEADNLELRLLADRPRTTGAPAEDARPRSDSPTFRK